MADKKTKTKIQTLLGVSDILPDQQPFFKKVYKTAQSISAFYGFKEITPPILEYSELFEKGTGVSTDIVEKEMYEIVTKSGDKIALRPEFTPSLARAYLEHGMLSLPQPVKLFSFGPVFRHERPQAGRSRQFNQFNFEVFGSDKPIIDVEIIYLCFTILKNLGLKNLIVQINSIGCKTCRADFRRSLVSYLKKNKSQLCPDCQRRLTKNPLRVLDCKEEKCMNVVAGAPQIIDHLCKDCHNHFKKVLEFLDELNIPYNLNPYLVRGLDYYTRTVFEIILEEDLGKRQATLIGGGRYDNLIKVFSNRDIPACGAAGGVERIILAMKNQGIAPIPAPEISVFLVQLGDKAKLKALKLIEVFRKNNLRLLESLDKGSLSAQLKIANRSGVRYTIIIGEKEANKGTVILRDMESGRQTTLKDGEIIKELKKRLSEKQTSKKKDKKI